MKTETVLPLGDAIREAHALDERLVIVAKEPFFLGSDAKFVEHAEDFTIPNAAISEGYVYFLGAYDLSKLLQECALKIMSREAEAEYVIHYAIHDAPPNWYYDLPPRADAKLPR